MVPATIIPTDPGRAPSRQIESMNASVQKDIKLERMELRSVYGTHVRIEVVAERCLGGTLLDVPLVGGQHVETRVTRAMRTIQRSAITCWPSCGKVR